MKAITPPLRVTGNKLNVIGVDTNLIWAPYNEFKKILQVPITQEFTLTLSREHLPYGVAIHLNRQQGRIELESPYVSVQMNLGWNDFTFRELITSGDYWISLTKPETKWTFKIPIKSTCTHEVAVQASCLEDAYNFVLNKGAGYYPIVTTGTTNYEIDTEAYLKTRKITRPRIGAFYHCQSASRPQINNVVVELVEIKTANQVGVRDVYGDVYYTSPANLVHVRG